MRPIIATFRSLRDKENILRHASSSRSLKKDGVYVTEDYGNKVRKPKNQPQSPTKTSEVSSFPFHKLFLESVKNPSKSTSQDVRTRAAHIREKMRENIRENMKDEGNLRETIREDVMYSNTVQLSLIQYLYANSFYM